jgi:hypothetical protein
MVENVLKKFKVTLHDVALTRGRIRSNSSLCRLVAAEIFEEMQCFLVTASFHKVLEARWQVAFESLMYAVDVF